MKRARSIPGRFSISLSILTAILLPSAVIADEPIKSPQDGAAVESPEPLRVLDPVVITVKATWTDGFFRQYIVAKTYRIDLAAVLAETEVQWRVANAFRDITEQLTAALRPPVWKQDYIPFSLPF